jgi:hypothetical protein
MTTKVLQRFPDLLLTDLDNWSTLNKMKRTHAVNYIIKTFLETHTDITKLSQENDKLRSTIINLIMIKKDG